MKALRTQIYLTREQRDKLDDLARTRRVSLAHVIREAIDSYLRSKRVDSELVDKALEETFGIDPNFSIPSRKELWGRRGAATRRH